MRARSPEARLDEAVGLARAIDLDIVAAEMVPGAALAAGDADRQRRGRASGALIGEREIGVAVVDAAVTPVQQRNLERAWKCKVIDRTGLILEIFGARARTREGTLQVELAALELSALAAGAVVDASRAPARRLRLPRRPRRKPARDRPPAHRRAHRQAEARARGGEAHPRAPPQRAPARAVIRWWRWWATPMPANRRCSTA